MEPKPEKLMNKKISNDRRIRGTCGATTLGPALPGTRGAALVIVLAFLILITVLVLAFFTSVTNETRTAASYASGASAKQLADSAVQMVMGTIKNATSQSSASSGDFVAWASQPGMIRTYDTGSASSTRIPLARDYYKLYSSDNMVVTRQQIDAGFDPVDDVDADWNNKPALYTDLNSPVASGTALQFPIIDPRAAAAVSGSYALVDGFSYSNKAGSKTVNGVSSPSNATDANARLPMPVKWLYMLQDGILVAADATSGTTATFANSPPYKRPSATNPIVGRIAFWTDDETCKLNVNTACGGNPWEPPMFTDAMDKHFSRYAPMKNEFTRYPGHPAMTSLLPVLWSVGGLSQPRINLFPTMSVTPYGTTTMVTSDYTGRQAEKNFQLNTLLLSPRNALGGSQLAELATTSTSAQVKTTGTMDSDRLYASVDELMFAMAMSGSARPPNSFAPAMDKGAVDKFRFFLTANSRAPEVNMFNLPKITMWPLPATTSKMVGNTESPGGAANRTAVDNLIAFCSTLNNQPYYFTRYDSTSPTNDFAPGSRNTTLCNYLNGLLQRPIPGFGAGFGATAGRNSNQIVTLCADYIRSAINLVDSTGVSNPADDKFKYSYTVPPVVKVGKATKNVGLDIGTGQVVPLALTLQGQATKGLGRFPTIKGATMMFIARRANQPPVLVNGAMAPILPPAINPMHPWQGAPPTSASVSGATVTADRLYPNHPGMRYLSGTLTGGAFAPNTAYSGPVLNPYETEMEAIFFIEPVNVAVGYTGLGCDYRIEVDGLKAFQITDRNGGPVSLFPGVADATSEVAQEDTYPMTVSRKASNYRFGGDQNYEIGKETHTIWRWSGGTGVSKLNFWSGANRELIVGPASSSSKIPNTFGQAFSFKGGDITVRIYPGQTSTTPVQTFTINFPDSTFPTPRLIAFQPGGGYILNPGQVTVENLSFDASSSIDISQSRLGLSSSRQNSGAPNFPSYFFAIPETNMTVDALTGKYKNSADPEGRYKLTVDTIRSVECKYGDTRLVASLATVPSSFFAPHKFYFDNLGAYNQATAMWDNPGARSAHTLRRCGDRYSQGYSGAVNGATAQPLSKPYGANYLALGGARINSYFGDWGNPLTATSPKVRTMLSSCIVGLYSPSEVAFTTSWPHTTSSVDFSDPYFTAIWDRGGDFDNGPIDHGDGPFINKAVEGVDFSDAEATITNPDYDALTQIPRGNLLCPNRQVPSPVIFGSLPRGVNPSNPGTTLDSAWQTLLFCPNPNSQTHTALSQVSLSGTLPTGSQCPDFALLDFFHMPVVEPYAISEPFSTAGKVNMNFQIAPFTYIRRDTALRGVLASTLLTSVPDKWIFYYKYEITGATLDNEARAAGYWYFRHPIHADQTLQQFQFRFDQGDIFRSPSEICSLFLYPAKQPATATDVAQLDPSLAPDSPGSVTNIKAWWYSGPGAERKSLTGDNCRERPYAQLYPRLTTKSNSYTVHFRVQMLRQGIAASTPASDPRWAQWDERKGQVLGEYRGSSLIERYVDPGDTTLPDFATNSTVTLDGYPDPNNPSKTLSAYNFRVVSTKKFTQ